MNIIMKVPKEVLDFYHSKPPNPLRFNLYKDFCSLLRKLELVNDYMINTNLRCYNGVCFFNLLYRDSYINKNKRRKEFLLKNEKLAYYHGNF